MEEKRSKLESIVRGTAGSVGVLTFAGGIGASLVAGAHDGYVGGSSWLATGEGLGVVGTIMFQYMGYWLADMALGEPVSPITEMDHILGSLVLVPVIDFAGYGATYGVGAALGYAARIFQG